MLTTLGYGYARAGRAGRRLRSAERLEALSKTRYVSPFALAVVDTGTRRTDSAFAQLERAFASTRTRWRSSRLSALREPSGDPRFAAC
jgi:hypothetical protein